MLTIRLQRAGKRIKGKYHYKIVVIEKSKPRDSSFIEELGYYNPSKELLKFNVERYQYWLEKGVKPVQKVISLFKRYKSQVKTST